jgi:hypothetical protein
MLTICAERLVSVKILCPSTQPRGTARGLETPIVSPTDRTIDHNDTSARWSVWVLVDDLLEFGCLEAWRDRAHESQRRERRPGHRLYFVD